MDYYFLLAGPGSILVGLQGSSEEENPRHFKSIKVLEAGPNKILSPGLCASQEGVKWMESRTICCNYGGSEGFLAE